MPMMIGQLSKKSGCGIETIRFYEKEGLLTPKGRRNSGYREYDDGALLRLRFIKRAKELGFSLKETKDLLDLSVSKDAKCRSVKKKTEEKIKDIDLRISDLIRIKQSLQDLASVCNENAKTTECPILENFYKGTKA